MNLIVRPAGGIVTGKEALVELIPYNNCGGSITEYCPLWFSAGGEYVGLDMSVAGVAFGISVWYNENHDGLWHAEPIVVIYLQECVTAPMGADFSGSDSEQVIQAAIRSALACLSDLENSCDGSQKGQTR
jgi:hypothetical protein